MKVLIAFYSMYGHIWSMAQAFAQGVAEVQGAEAQLCRVPETLPEEVLHKMGALEPQKQWADLPVCTPDDLVAADAIAFGTPTRFGSACGQMRQFLDATGGLWAKGALVGKPGSVFVSTATQHGGQEATILSMHVNLLHHGMVIVGLPYAFAGLTVMNEISGGSPYGASTLADHDGSRQPSENELAGARYQGAHLARIAAKLTA